MASGPPDLQVLMANIWVKQLLGAVILSFSFLQLLGAFKPPGTMFGDWQFLLRSFCSFGSWFSPNTQVGRSGPPFFYMIDTDGAQQSHKETQSSLLTVDEVWKSVTPLALLRVWSYHDLPFSTNVESTTNSRVGHPGAKLAHARFSSRRGHGSEVLLKTSAHFRARVCPG